VIKVIVFLEYLSKYLNAAHMVFVAMLQVTSPANNGKILPSLTHADRGRFAVIVFERLETYLSLDSWNRQLLDKYCRDFAVGIVAFVQPDEGLYNAQVCMSAAH